MRIQGEKMAVAMREDRFACWQSAVDKYERTRCRNGASIFKVDNLYYLAFYYVSSDSSCFVLYLNSNDRLRSFQIRYIHSHVIDMCMDAQTGHFFLLQYIFSSFYLTDGTGGIKLFVILTL